MYFISSVCGGGFFLCCFFSLAALSTSAHRAVQQQGDPSLLLLIYVSVSLFIHYSLGSLRFGCGVFESHCEERRNCVSFGPREATIVNIKCTQTRIADSSILYLYP